MQEMQMRNWGNLGIVETIYEEECEFSSSSSPSVSPSLLSPHTPLHSRVEAWSLASGRKTDILIRVQGTCFRLHKQQIPTSTSVIGHRRQANSVVKQISPHPSCGFHEKDSTSTPHRHGRAMSIEQKETSDARVTMKRNRGRSKTTNRVQQRKAVGEEEGRPGDYYPGVEKLRKRSVENRMGRVVVVAPERELVVVVPDLPEREAVVVVPDLPEMEVVVVVAPEREAVGGGALGQRETRVEGWVEL